MAFYVAVIQPEREFADIAAQVLVADLMVDAVNPPFWSAIL